MADNVYGTQGNIGGGVSAESVTTLVAALYGPIAQIITKQTISEMLPDIVKQVAQEINAQGTPISQVDEAKVQEIVKKQIKGVKTHITTKVNHVEKLINDLQVDNEEVKKFLSDPTSGVPKQLIDILDTAQSNKALLAGQGAELQSQSKKIVEMDKKLDVIIEALNNIQTGMQPPVIPEQPVTPPEQPETPPEQPVTPPEQPVTPPEQPVTPPEQPETPPEQPVTPPEQPVTPPEQPVTPPEQPVTPPEQPVTPPEQPVTPPEQPVTPPEEGSERWLKGKLLNSFLRRTNMLSEPRRPFFKRIASFAVNHPVLTALAGAGIGLLGAGAVIGIGAASHVIAGGIGIGKVLTIFAPAFGISAGVGAITGGVASFVGRLFPGGKTERLIHKFRKRERQWQKAKENADHLKGKEFAIEEKRKEVREKARESRGITRWINRTHEKVLRRTALKYRLKGISAVYKIKPAAMAAIDAKENLNKYEKSRGKNQALAGYVDKMSRLDQKRKKQDAKVEDLFTKGKITKEERDARLEDNGVNYEQSMEYLEQDFEVIKGGAPGLRGVSKDMRTFDTEVEDIAKTLGDDARAQQVIEEIRLRNSKKKEEIVEETYRDPVQVDAEIAEMRKDPEKEKLANFVESVNDSRKSRRKAYEQYAQDHGIEVEPEKILTPEEVAAWKKRVKDRRKPVADLPESTSNPADSAPEKE